MIKEIEIEKSGGDKVTIELSKSEGMVVIALHGDLKIGHGREEGYLYSTIDPHDILRAYNALKGEENDVT